MLRIDSVSVENLKGIERAEFPLGSLTVIKGSNGTGKSSILDAIATVFEGGHDPTLIRSGADKAHVKLTLSDGTVITKTITPKGSTLNITTADGLKDAVQAEADKRVAAVNAAKAEALAARKTEIAAQIATLQADVKSSLQDAVQAEADKRVAAVNAAKAEALAARKTEIAAQIATLQADVKSSLQDAVQAEADKRVAAVNAAKAEALAARKTEIAAQIATLQADVKSSLQDAVQAEADKRVAAVNAAKAIYDAALQAANLGYESAVSELNKLAPEASAEESAALQAELQTVSADYATADERRRQQDQSIAMRRQIDTLDEKRLTKVSASDKLSAQLKALDDLRKDKLSAAAIPGIEIVNGEILVDGIPLDNLNTQARYFVAFQIAALKGGELGFMVVDNLEAIVGDEWEDFQAAAVGSGYQVLGARAVEHTALSLDADGQAVVL